MPRRPRIRPRVDARHLSTPERLGSPPWPRDEQGVPPGERQHLVETGRQRPHPLAQDKEQPDGISRGLHVLPLVEEHHVLLNEHGRAHKGARPPQVVLQAVVPPRTRRLAQQKAGHLAKQGCDAGDISQARPACNRRGQLGPDACARKGPPAQIYHRAADQRQYLHQSVTRPLGAGNELLDLRIGGLIRQDDGLDHLEAARIALEPRKLRG